MVDFEVIGFGFWIVVPNIQILAYCSQYTELWVDGLTDGSSNGGGHGYGGRLKGLTVMDGNSNGNGLQQLNSNMDALMEGSHGGAIYRYVITC